MALGNGWPVIDVRRRPSHIVGKYTVTVYMRIPVDLATPIEGGCACEYCKAHLDRVPMWDTLAVCDVKGDHAWTVHMPDPRGW